MGWSNYRSEKTKRWRGCNPNVTADWFETGLSAEASARGLLASMRNTDV